MVFKIKRVIILENKYAILYKINIKYKLRIISL